MINYNKENPILLVISGANENIRQIYSLFERIEPQRLYLFYDNQTKGHEYIKTFLNEIPWKCKLKTFYNKTYLGHNAAMLKATHWFFQQETEGIILNGLYVPPAGFFAFCSSMLEKYRDDERIGHISGMDFLNMDKNKAKKKTNDSYYFSKLVNVSSGWASWRRVWKDISVQQKTFHAFKKSNIIEKIPSHKQFRYHWHYFEPFEKQWEISYEYVNLINNRLSVVPDFCQISFNNFELIDIKHPVFMVTPLDDEQQFQEQRYSMQAIETGMQEGFRFLREKLLSFDTKAGDDLKIPRIIHQIYEDPAGPPAALLNIAESWKENMPGWEYRFWNRQMMHDFLESTCPDFVEYYRSYPFNVQRWNAIRYLILYRIGGLYADLDYECIRPLDVLLSGSTCCMGMEPTFHNRKYYNKDMLIGNALMAAKPGHPYMASIIEDMKVNFNVDYRKNDSMQIMESTGPLMVTRVYERFKKKKDITLLPADLVAPLQVKEIWMLRSGHAGKDILKKVEESFAIHYFFNTWLIQTAEGKISQKMLKK